MPKVLVYSQQDFDKICVANDWTDETVESLQDVAFISIIDSPTSMSALIDTVNDYLPHHFKHNHNNVLNLEFDDEDSDREWTCKDVSGVFKTMSEQQAKDCYEFINQNIGKTFYIHCRAGVSRSQAVSFFIKEFFPEFEYEERKDNPCLYPNVNVLLLLKREFYKDVGFLVQ